MRNRLVRVYGALAAGALAAGAQTAAGAAPTLGEALDSTNLVWSTGGATPWFGQTSHQSDGMDAAQSGPLGDNQSNWIETTVTGPGLLYFSWRVSCDEGWDYLRFEIGATERATLTGEPDWERVSVEVPAGSQTLRWSYTKDAIAYSGLDAGWVDLIVFVPQAGRPPTIDVPPQSQAVFAGQRATFTVGVGGSEPFAYQWQAYGQTQFTDLSTTPSLVLTNVAPSAPTLYRVIVTNNFGSVTSATASLEVLPPIPLSNALDGTGLAWQTGGPTAWFGVTNFNSDGKGSAQSGWLTHSQTNWIQTTVNGPGSVSFWWRVSSEHDYDLLTFSMGGQELASIYGESRWLVQSFPVPAGETTLRWQYAKDFVGTYGLDAAWVDQVRFLPPTVTAVPEILVRGLEAPLVWQGGQFTFSFITQPAVAYRVEYKEDAAGPSWTTLTNVTGTGGIALVTDAGAQGRTRFYRVRLP